MDTLGAKEVYLLEAKTQTLMPKRSHPLYSCDTLYLSPRPPPSVVRPPQAHPSTPLARKHFSEHNVSSKDWRKKASKWSSRPTATNPDKLAMPPGRVKGVAGLYTPEPDGERHRVDSGSTHTRQVRGAEKISIVKESSRLRRHFSFSRRLRAPAEVQQPQDVHPPRPQHEMRDSLDSSRAPRRSRARQNKRDKYTRLSDVPAMPPLPSYVAKSNISPALHRHGNTSNYGSIVADASPLDPSPTECSRLLSRPPPRPPRPHAHPLTKLPTQPCPPLDAHSANELPTPISTMCLSEISIHKAPRPKLRSSTEHYKPTGAPLPNDSASYKPQLKLQRSKMELTALGTIKTELEILDEKDMGPLTLWELEGLVWFWHCGPPLSAQRAENTDQTMQDAVAKHWGVQHEEKVTEKRKGVRHRGEAIETSQVQQRGDTVNAATQKESIRKCAGRDALNLETRKRKIREAIERAVVGRRIFAAER